MNDSTGSVPRYGTCSYPGGVESFGKDHWAWSCPTLHERERAREMVGGLEWSPNEDLLTVKAALRLGPRDAGVRLTPEEFADAEYEEPFIYERVGGRLVVMTPAGPEHRRVSRPFRRELGGYWHGHPQQVDEVDVEGWVATSPNDDRIPDICVYLAGSSSDQTVPHRVPDLIFEFVSSERSDQERGYIDKRSEYHRIGVREYVIVDRFKRGALVLTWQEEDFEERWLSRDEVYTTLLLPGLAVSLREVFTDHDP